MALTITDRDMTSAATEHRAEVVVGYFVGESGERVDPVDAGEVNHSWVPELWRVSWCPETLLSRDQAVTAMAIAETVGRIPAGAGPEAYSSEFWLHVDGWAGELGLTGADAVARASEAPYLCPQCRADGHCHGDETCMCRCGSSS